MDQGTDGDALIVYQPPKPDHDEDLHAARER
jgi:hypothetical protein